MSIKEVGKKSNPPKALPNEEEFDIVSVDSVAQNKGTLNEALLYVGIVVLMGGISFGVGKLVAYSNSRATVTISHIDAFSEQVASPATFRTVKPQEKTVTPQKTTKTAPVEQKPETKTSTLTSGPIVASKNGSKYYLISCSGAKRISEANKIYFATEQDAKDAGLSPSSTCKGLK